MLVNYFTINSVYIPLQFFYHGLLIGLKIQKKFRPDPKLRRMDQVRQVLRISIIIGLGAVYNPGNYSL